MLTCMSLKHCLEVGKEMMQLLLKLIDWCVSKNVNIISLSLGGNASGFSIILGSVEESVENAWAGIVVIAAAGNDGQNDDGDVSSPGIVDTVIYVGGVDVNETYESSVGDNNGRI